MLPIFLRSPFVELPVIFWEALRLGGSSSWRESEWVNKIPAGFPAGMFVIWVGKLFYRDLLIFGCFPFIVLFLNFSLDDIQAGVLQCLNVLGQFNIGVD
jgi:hypothetical protein